MGLWTGCVAGALLEGAYKEQPAKAGFEKTDIEPTHVFDRADIVRMAGDLLATGDVPETLDVEATTAALDEAVMSAFVRASKRNNRDPDRSDSQLLLRAEDDGTGISKLPDDRTGGCSMMCRCPRALRVSY